MLRFWKTRLNIEKAIYENRINVALEHFEKSDTYKNFLEKLENALYKQIRQVASNSTAIDSALLFSKSKNIPMEQQIAAFITGLAKLLDLNRFVISAGEAGGQAGLDKIEIQGTFVLKNPKLIEYFQGRSNLIINSVDSYTKEWIARKIQEGKENGLTTQQIGQELTDLGRGISRIRAERIALTETANAMTIVEIETASRYGIRHKIWRTSKDESVCPICLPLEGKKTEIRQTFPGGYQGPPAHVSCRCFIEEVIPEEWSLPQNPWFGE